jgi:hypothetical protein
MTSLEEELNHLKHEYQLFIDTGKNKKAEEAIADGARLHNLFSLIEIDHVTNGNPFLGLAEIRRAITAGEFKVEGMDIVLKYVEKLYDKGQEIQRGQTKSRPSTT